MRTMPSRQSRPPIRFRERGRSGIRLLLALGLGLLIGLGVGGIRPSRRVQQSSSNTGAETDGQDSGTLSAGTMAVLHHLQAPVQIKFYALLDAATVPGEMTSFAGRVEELLTAYQRASGGRIKITRLQSRSDVRAAAADGMKPFNLEKGDACYLGLTVVQGERKESIPRLGPEWEQAIESDISRVISRVAGPAAAASSASAPLAIDPATLAEVKRLIPNYASVSPEAGAQIVRENALKDLQAALIQTAGQIQELQQRLTRMEEAKAETEKQTALQELQRLQAQQAAMLREFTIRSSAQIEALRQLQDSALGTR